MMSPFIVDTRDLGRRAGMMQEKSLTFQSPQSFGTDFIQVPPGEDISIELRLECVIDGILASGVASTVASSECVRCLEPLEIEVSADFQDLYSYEPMGEETFLMDGDLLDLEPAIRDALVLALPQSPYCTEDCLGLCPVCGFEMKLDPSHGHEAIDPRWQALTGLLQEKEGSDDGSTKA